ncbi:Bacteriocin-like prepeptide [Ligilactobacillus salivarius cp400]|uniref:Bacteriocin-like prepeptide n=1 Tax=Ligilactobacillus salivarius cp400 TaxID=1273133 RepID=V6DMU2_9LACO|nr:Bacteriocin-like prepeptide [Ligilactobacillus salivarius cp400]
MDGGFIRGKKRYVIAPVIWALLIPLGIWLFGNEDMSYLDYIQTPKMIIVAIFCLIGGSTLLYLLDTTMKVNKHMKG